MLQFLAAFVAMFVVAVFPHMHRPMPFRAAHPMMKTEDDCTVDFRFSDAALTPQGSAGTVPAHVLLEGVWGIGDPAWVERDWVARCRELHADADYNPDGTRQDSFTLSVEDTYTSEHGVKGWALHYASTLETASLDYATQYLLLDAESGAPLTFADLVAPEQAAAAQATIEHYVLSPEVTGLQYSDSGLIDGVTSPPVDFLPFMSVGYSDSGVMVFGWIPDILGGIPVNATVPWSVLAEYTFRKDSKYYHLSE